MSTERRRPVRCNVCEAVFTIPEGPKEPDRICMEYWAVICPECCGAFAVRWYYPTDDMIRSSGRR